MHNNYQPHLVQGHVGPYLQTPIQKNEMNPNQIHVAPGTPPNSMTDDSYVPFSPLNEKSVTQSTAQKQQEEKNLKKVNQIGQKEIQTNFWQE